MPKPKSFARQRGATLVTSLIILGVLALIGVSAVMVANTQFRMSANLQLQTLAMSDAENALSSAETWLLANYASNAFVEKTAAGIYPVNQEPNVATMTWDDTTSVKVDAAGNQRYIIAMYAPNRPLPSNSVSTPSAYGGAAPTPFVNVYRVTARGISRAGATRIVQTYFSVRTVSN